MPMTFFFKDFSSPKISIVFAVALAHLLAVGAGNERGFITDLRFGESQTSGHIAR